MGTSQRREREKEEMRGRIMDAARSLFAAGGYESVSMRAIAEAIEYSPTAIYYHFKDKEELFQSLCQEDFGRLLGYFAAAPPPDDPVEEIRRLGHAYARFGLEHPNHYRFLFMTPARNVPVHTEPGDDPGKQSFGMLRRAVERAVEGGRFRKDSPETIATVLWAMMHGVVALIITIPKDAMPECSLGQELVDAAVESSIRGFLAPGEPTGRVPGRAAGPDRDSSPGLLRTARPRARKAPPKRRR